MTRQFTADEIAKFGKWASKTIRPDVREKATKVLALAERGATDGERSAAKARLAVLATKANVSTETLIQALSRKG